MPLFTRFLFLLFIILPYYTYSQVELKVLNESWTFRNSTDTLVYDAKVPGSIYSDLYRNQLIPDPFMADNEKRLQWIENEIWVYQCNFELSQAQLNHQNIQLNLEGIDTYAKVFLNNELLLETESMFLAYHKNIKDLLNTKNELRIEILPPLLQIPNNDSIKYSGGPQAHVRKAAFQFGWDWAPRYAAGGIWKDISIEFQNKASIEEVYFKLNSLDHKMANYTVFIGSKFNKAGIYDFIVEDSINNISQKISAHVLPSVSLYNLEIRIPNPKLWWPIGMGESYLYNFQIRILQKGKIIDQKDQKIGVCKIELINQVDKEGKSFYFQVNGQSIYIKGANYVPQSIFVGTETKPETILKHIKESNMNMIRIWGGGIYESDRFYDLCDSVGILVWQDFMFANSVYPENSNFLHLVEEEVKQQLKRLKNHPSIALWCGNNEISEAWHNWGWQKQFGYSPTDSTALWNNYQNIFDTILPNSVSYLSHGTPYWTSSPQYGRGNPLSRTNGDFHYWGVWHDGHHFDSLEHYTGRFMSEFGFQSYPSISTINKFSNEEELGIESISMKAHQKHSRGNAIIQKYMMDIYGFVPEEFDDFVYLSQMTQSYGISKGLKAQRRNQPFCMGSLYWQLNDAWPAISWSGIDYYGNWKPMQYAVREAYKPIALSHELNGSICSIYSISDFSQDVRSNIKIQVMDFYGKVVLTNELEITIENGKSQLQHKLETANINPHKQFIRVEIFKNDSLMTHEYIYLAQPKDLELPKPELTINQSYNQDLGCIVLKLDAKSLIKNLWLETNDTDGNRFSNNNFDIGPEETKTIYIKSKSTHIDLQIKSLNQLSTNKKKN